jgi:16S rRNA (guanine527-N7)-methyltransferase
MSRVSDELALRIRSVCVAAGASVTVPQSTALANYLELLERWNQTINLTGFRLTGFPAEAINQLIVEPILAAQFVPEGAVEWVDVGSGGGSPAIPLKIVRPESRLTMIEAKERKSAFLREASRLLGLTDVSVETARTEAVAGRQTAELLTIRAVRTDELLVAAITELIAPGGSLLIFGDRDKPLVPGFFGTEHRLVPGSPHRLWRFQRST